MGRPRKRRKQDVSLFPFLDILACVIGNLILIITAVVLEQVDTTPVAEAARIADLAVEAERQQAKAAELRRQAERLRPRSADAEAELAAIRAKLSAATTRLEAANERLRQATQPVGRPSAGTADLERLVAERKRLEAESKVLERQIADRRKLPEPMIAILPPDARGGPRKGVFVEAAKDGIVIHAGASPRKVATSAIASDPTFRALLEAVKGDADAIVTFLVRPDGLAALAAGQKAAAAAGARSGRVPLPGQGGLDLSGAKEGPAGVF